mmetsp:Transcript_5423/g.9568  ORF Transcript_5423/g.9568 Transcript_5423/m.9568 type:complete len:175 (+) Transcript_5423:2254-2778(+)
MKPRRSTKRTVASPTRDIVSGDTSSDMDTASNPPAPSGKGSGTGHGETNLELDVEDVFDTIVPAEKNEQSYARGKPKKFQMAQIALYFHLPRKDAATQMGVCETVLKRRCRRLDIRRWPFRKLKCLEEKKESLMLEPESFERQAKVEQVELMMDLVRKNPNFALEQLFQAFAFS